MRGGVGSHSILITSVHEPFPSITFDSVATVAESSLHCRNDKFSSRQVFASIAPRKFCKRIQSQNVKYFGGGGGKISAAHPSSKAVNFIYSSCVKSIKSINLSIHPAINPLAKKIHPSLIHHLIHASSLLSDSPTNSPSYQHVRVWYHCMRLAQVDRF